VIRAWRPDEIRAGAALALLLFAVAQAAPRWREPGEVPACSHPVSIALSEIGHTRAVRCDAAEGEGAVLRGPARVLYGLGIDPNEADAKTLEALPGVGPARAAAIVAGRAEGPYRAPSDLLRVRGIGPVTLEQIRAWLSFPAPTRTGRLGVTPLEPAP
jgi:competence ComEA-like helix-hairpin-helix protein